jgi:hypothetical protein
MFRVEFRDILTKEIAKLDKNNSKNLSDQRNQVHVLQYFNNAVTKLFV